VFTNAHLVPQQFLTLLFVISVVERHDFDSAVVTVTALWRDGVGCGFTTWDTTRNTWKECSR
jgi:hypothetical protein